MHGRGVSPTQRGGLKGCFFPAASASSHAFLLSDSMDIRNEWNAKRQKNRWVMQRDQHAPSYKLEQYFKTKIVT